MLIHNKKSDKGFTLIEAMVAMLIVSVGMLAMATLLITIIKVNHGSEKRMDASTTAQTIVTHLITQVRTTAGLTQADLQTNAVNLLADKANVFTPTVVTSATTAGCGFTDIALTLSWSDLGVNKRLVLQSGAFTDTGGC